MNSAEVVRVLEVIASEQPDLIGPLVEALEFSPARRGLAALAEAWEEQIADLGDLAIRTARHLDRLEKRSGAWRHPDQVVEAPHVPALASFVVARCDRVTPEPRSRRLNVLAIKLQRIATLEQERRKLEAFLREPMKPVDPEWLRDFMGWQP
jgi:hypothetical protein